jgi:type I restriction enzyme, S subunit
MTELPRSWVWTTIGEVCQKPKYGWTTSASDNGDVKLLRTTDLTHGPINWDTVPFCKETPKNVADFEVHPNDIFISRAGSVGVSAFVKDAPYKSVFASYLIRVRPTESIDSKYLSLFLESPHYWNQVIELSSGIALANINATKIQSMTLPLPPIYEQHKIVELLEDHLSRLDAAVADVKQAKLKAAQFRRSLLQAAFTGNLGSGGGSFKTELPGGWRLSTIGEVAEIIRGVTYSKADTLSENDKDAVPLLRATNLEVDSIDFEDMVYVPKHVVKAQQFLELNDILLAASSGSISVVGKSAQVVKTNGETFGAFCAVIRPKEIHPKFLSYWVQSPEIRDHWSATAKGTNINNLKPSDISETKIYVPPLDEQHEIVELLEDHISRLDISVSIADAMEKQSIGLRRSLLQAAFTGQLTKEVVSV